VAREDDRGGRRGQRELLNKYLEGGELSEEEIKQGLRARAIKNEIVLCMCGTAFKNKGVQALLDAVIEFMPSPIEMPPVKGTDERRRAGHAQGRATTSRSRRWRSRS
jgi:translation elongation factor EF-G